MSPAAALRSFTLRHPEEPQAFSSCPTRSLSIATPSNPPQTSHALTPVFATDPRNCVLTPFLATLPQMPFRNTFVCHTCDPLPRFALPRCDALSSASSKHATVQRAEVQRSFLATRHSPLLSHFCPLLFPLFSCK